VGTQRKTKQKKIRWREKRGERFDAPRFSAISIFRAATASAAFVLTSVSPANYCEKVSDSQFLVEEHNIVENLAFTRESVIFNSF